MRSVGENLSLTFRAEPDAVSRGRDALCAYANAAGADARQVDAVRLASSEALTNVVLHAYRGEPGNVYATAAVVSGELWILIADDGCGLEPGSNRPGLGLGLGLIAQLSDDLAIGPRAGGGTEVRMRFNLVGARPSPGIAPSGSKAHGSRRQMDRARCRRSFA